MRVIHIIPSAFNYFDDIRAEAFALVDGLYKIGIESEAITIKYGTTTNQNKKEIHTKAPSYKYLGNEDFNEVIKRLRDFDIVHVHCPGFGALGKILSWKKNNKNQRLVVSYYRDVFLVDLFSIIIKIYNYFYLPKIFDEAEAVTFLSLKKFTSSRVKYYLKNVEKLVILGGVSNDNLTKNDNQVKLINNREEVLKSTVLLYDYLIS